MTRRLVALFLLALPAGAAERESLGTGPGLVQAISDIASPAGAGALGPNLARTSSGVYLSWLEPLSSREPGAEREGRAESHALRVARLRMRGRGAEASWDAPVTVEEGDAFFANWADFPGVGALPRGGLLAHWLERTGDDKYAYGVRLARSQDRGKTWEPLGFLHDDRSATEHGFVAWASTTGGTRAFWLDGRSMASEGPMALRTVSVTGRAEEFESDDPATPRSEVLDERVCECCQTDAAVARDGPVVVYRDRSEDEVRDIAIVRATAAGWSAPRTVYGDGWRIAGCPVNGPAVDASGLDVAVAWFTGADGRPAVKAAVSRDGGATFAQPLVLDGEAPIGRVDVALAGDSAWFLWLGRSAAGATLRLRGLQLGGEAESELEPAATLAETDGARSSGFPRMLALGRDRLLVAWVDTRDGQRIRTALVTTRP